MPGAVGRGAAGAGGGAGHGRTATTITHSTVLADVSLRVTVAAPFRQRGTRRMGESEFVVALSLDRDWFSPDQAKRVVDLASGEGLLDREGDDLVAAFEPGSVTVPDDFTPEESILRERSPFERVLERLVEAGHDKQTAVAEINALQQELAVSVEAAAVVYAQRNGVEVAGVADRALTALADEE
jgi:hypothetical protein